MDTLRDLAGAPRRASAAFAGGREVVPMMKCRIDDYKNVLEVLSQDSSDTFKHEVKRLGDLLKRLETLYATHTETKNGIVSFVKATNRGCLHEEIKNDISAIDAEAIRQLTAVAAVAAKSAIGHELTRRGPWGFPAATGDPKGSSFGGDAQSFGRYAPGPGLVGSSEPPKGLGDRGTVRDYRSSNWDKIFDDDNGQMFWKNRVTGDVTRLDPYSEQWAREAHKARTKEIVYDPKNPPPKVDERYDGVSYWAQERERNGDIYWRHLLTGKIIRGQDPYC